jgi:MGT family glycosyltransferase
MSRLLFVVLTGHGHVNPTLPLVAELVRRGHDVDYATAPEHADAVTGAGARWVPLPAMPPFVPPSDDMRAVMPAWFRHFFAAMAATYPVLLDRCRAERPDAICYDGTNWPARLVARQLDVPAARTVPNLASNKEFSLLPSVADDPALAEFADDCARFAQEHGVPIDPIGTFDVPERLNLVFVPREFQPAGDTFDDTFRFVGPILDGDAHAPVTPAPDLFISLGSILTDADFYRTCVDAFGDGRWQVAMTVGDVDPADLALPSTVDARPRFPQLAVLRQVSAFVTHAGMNSVMEALTFGVPLVLLPRTPEQLANADRVEELGLGVRVTADPPTAEALRDAVLQVSESPTTRANLARMRAAIEASGGATRAATELVDYLA